MRVRFPGDLRAAFARAVESWSAEHSTERLWRRDATLWTGSDEGRWLGWLDGPEREASRLGLYAELPRRAVQDGVRDVVLLGMGGSSLGAELFRRSWQAAGGGLRLHMVEPTHPEQIESATRAVDPRSTWVLVASKSGATLEPNLLLAAFFDRFERALGAAAPRRFLAITDPGSALENLARERGFLALIPGEPTIGGRFSAISPFGLAPAAFLGVDLARFVERTASMAGRCRAVDVLDNPGVGLGLAIAVAAEQGRDKLTLIVAPGIEALGAWLEQLIAESTGKRGRMILPIDGEPAHPPEQYGRDRLFVVVRLGGALTEAGERRVAELVEAGQPLIELDCRTVDEIGGELFRWEIATAAAGARLGVHPFDQPDVEAAKIATRRLTAAVEATGELPPETAFLAEAGLELHADEANRAELLDAVDNPTIAGLLGAHFGRARSGDYIALLAFLEMSAENERALAALRGRAATRSGIATTVGFGPRFLHSTGQAHKGGPPSGLFLQITERPVRDLPVPGRRLSFGQVLAAQARGDLEVLAERGRRHLRLHFPDGAAAGWQALEGAWSVE